MKQEKIESILKDLGLSAKEIALFIFLGKSGPIHSSEITRQLKMNRGQVFRLLQKLQSKGLVEATLEYPKRYVIVPFENIIDSFIKSKKQEVKMVESIKGDLIADWKKISQIELESSLERFSVIEGSKKIFNKIGQMFKNTEERFFCSLKVADLIKSNQYGAFEHFTNQNLNPSVQYKILTEPLSQNLKAIQLLNKKLAPAICFKGTDPTFSSANFVRMVIRDQKEIILFISENDNESGNNLVLCTNCKSIIQAFSGVFEESWNNSKLIETRLEEIKTGKSSSNTQIIKDPSKSMSKYYDVLNSAKKELFLVTSSEGLISLVKDKSKMKEWFDSGLAIKVMAPITHENLHAAQVLLEFCEIRHIPLGYLETAIIDDNHMFQFGYNVERNNLEKRNNFANAFYTDDSQFIKKTRRLLLNIWKKTRMPSSESVRSLTGPQSFQNNEPIEHHTVLKKRAFHKNLTHIKTGKISEQDVLDKIKLEKNRAVNDKDNLDIPVRFFGTRAFALIQPPQCFHIPKMIIGVFQDEKESCTEGQNFMVIDLYLKLKDTSAFVPVAVIQDTAKGLEKKKRNLKGFPAANNVNVFDKDHFQVYYNGTSLFVGWTEPITLIESKYMLPPACILFEGYGKVKSGMFTNNTSFGQKFEIWYNSVDSFVTFFHPQSKYIGAGTEGYIDKESFWMSTPERKK